MQIRGHLRGVELHLVPCAVLFIIWCLGFGISDCYGAKDITAAAGLDKKSVFIGDKIKYTIEVKAPTDTAIELPQFAENLGGFAVKDFAVVKKKRFFKREVIYKQQYILDTYTAGTYEIPPAKIKYKTPAGKEDYLFTEKVASEVKSALNIDGKPAADIKDIKSPLYFLGKWKLIALLALGLMLTAAAIIILFLKRKKTQTESQPKQPAHEIAYEQLRDLQMSGLLSRGLIKEYFFRLSFIVRQYIENRFQLRAPEMTTEEFLTAMRGSDALDSQIKGLLKGFLEKADMVKFAKYGPAAEEITAAFDAAKRLVDETAI